ncbi:cobalamin biosynthesis protein CobD [Rhodoferax aquaticus]|uniref:Cobalamin biosynthesis protein CobD n=2 Tax=Rhodoferax aquaticus TaxID=2527691 RepID=A0A515EVL5_9BURK|nr:cobalamin biosynthesis protein CobD [Rhodoferax aquaticus]
MEFLFLPVLVCGIAVLVALAIDHFWGEPPVNLHPVVWMGNYLAWAGAKVQARTVADPLQRDLRAFAWGALAWCVGLALVLLVALLAQAGAALLFASLASSKQGPWVPADTHAQSLSWYGAVLVCGALLGLLLKPLLAWAMLRSEVLAVEDALSGPQGCLESGRQRLSWLVSRDVAALSESGVRESAIESLAENLNDSVVAPLFWFILAGLPGAAMYRFANTADAMWGYPGVYKGRNWACAGKWAARVDDVLSYVPARITAWLLALVSGGQTLTVLQAQARRTPSPNSGWPMAAMALGLGVCLQKPGVYVLNAQGRAPLRQDTLKAIVYARNSVLALVLIAQTAIVLVAFGWVV